MSLLEVYNLTKRYGQEAAVDDVSFLLNEHTATALIGPNGAGKTTTLSMLAGMLKPTKGTINWPKEMGMGFLPQYPQFFPWLTALEFTEMAAKLSGVDAKNIRLQSTRTLEFVGLGNALNKKTAAFSGGMKQRLGLAQAIVHQPKLLLLDEPVSALDPTGRREIMNLLKSLQQDTTILYSTHILNDAEEMTDQVLFMQNGQLVEQGSLSDVKERHAEPRIRIAFHSNELSTLFMNQTSWQGSVSGATVFLAITENGPTMQEVLAALGTWDQGVLGVELQTATLEEIFLKVASGK
ncbi:ATP-binding cassette domain-containing protein [Planococcus sp. YIM B11945]|uniref:ABC transporter ATP-binding protein n=1 Tax=Planococcus sp. YIM B11945 TaxID=3435410 RepID=UPI003D7D3E5C